MAERSLEEMRAAIQRGESVLYKGVIRTKLEQLPSEAVLAVGNPVAEARARQDLDQQINFLQSQRALLDDADTARNYFAAGQGVSDDALQHRQGAVGGDNQTGLNFPPAPYTRTMNSAAVGGVPVPQQAAPEEVVIGRVATQQAEPLLPKATVEALQRSPDQQAAPVSSPTPESHTEPVAPAPKPDEAPILTQDPDPVVEGPTGSRSRRNS